MFFVDVCPRVKPEIPPRGIVFANASTVAHQVIHGNRVVGSDGFMPRASLYSPYGSEWDKVEGWKKQQGILALKINKLMLRAVAARAVP